MVNKYIKTLIILLAIIVTISGCAKKVKYTISGSIYDYNGEAVPDVVISSPEGITASTDKNGRWSMTLEGYGDVTITPAKSGWLFAPNNLEVRNNLSYTEEELIFMALPEDEDIVINDPNLISTIENKAGLKYDELTASDVVDITYLNAQGSQISNLGGIEYFIGLEDLNLQDNNITDITSLKNLYNIEQLNLSYNSLSNINELVEPLNNMSSLHWLDLSANGISDISSLADIEFNDGMGISLNFNNISDITALGSIEGLWSLDLRDNQIADISPLATQKELGYLDLSLNQIEDISVLENMDNLRELNIGGNNISNIDVLLTLDSLKEVNISDNNLNLSPGSDESAVVEELRNRGITVITN